MDLIEYIILFQNETKIIKFISEINSFKKIFQFIYHGWFARWRNRRAHSPTFPSLHLRHSSFSNPSVALPTSQLILQPFRRFTYVKTHFPALPLLHLRHSLFSNPYLASPTSQALHLRHLASRPCYLPILFFFSLHNGYRSTKTSSIWVRHRGGSKNEMRWNPYTEDQRLASMPTDHVWRTIIGTDEKIWNEIN